MNRDTGESYIPSADLIGDFLNEFAIDGERFGTRAFRPLELVSIAVIRSNLFDDASEPQGVCATKPQPTDQIVSPAI
jgi:hypothetical protein